MEPPGCHRELGFPRIPRSFNARDPEPPEDPCAAISQNGNFQLVSPPPPHNSTLSSSRLLIQAVLSPLPYLSLNVSPSRRPSLVSSQALPGSMATRIISSKRTPWAHPIEYSAHSTGHRPVSPTSVWTPRGQWLGIPHGQMALNKYYLNKKLCY